VKKLIFIFLLSASIYAQYIPEIAEYRVYWDKLNTGQTLPTPGLTITLGSQTNTLTWKRGTDNIGYTSPYAKVNFLMNVIANNTALWSVSGATKALAVTLAEGMYEVTMTEVDVNNNASNRSQPFFVKVIANYAKVPLTISIQ